MALPPRSQRNIEVADHLWSVLETMSAEMSTDVAALVNQALFALARQHGYLSPGSVINTRPPTPSAPTIIPASHKDITGAMEKLSAPPPAPVPPPSSPSKEKVKRGAAKATEVARSSKAEKTGAVEKVPTPDLGYLPEEVSGSQPRIAGMIEEELDDTRRPAKGSARKLFIFTENREPTEVPTTGRFIMGRDASCNMVLLSSRLSRQHAVLFRDGTTWMIEDMGSSNGTWFNGERMTKRPISDGEKYTLGDIVLQFAFR